MSASCQSLTSQLIKVAGDYFNKYQDFRKSAAKVYVDTIIPGKPEAASQLNKLIDQAFDLQTDLLNSYGKLTGEGSGKIGARDLQIPAKKVTGSLILTERTFFVAPSPFDKVIVTIKKQMARQVQTLQYVPNTATGISLTKKKNQSTREKIPLEMKPALCWMIWQIN